MILMNSFFKTVCSAAIYAALLSLGAHFFPGHDEGDGPATSGTVIALRELGRSCDQPVADLKWSW